MTKDEKGSSGSISDVDNIRKILFGDQIIQIEDHIRQVENSINQLRAENSNLRQALEMEVSAREKAVQELNDLLMTTSIAQTDIWNQNHAYQAGLMEGLKKVIDRFQSEIVPTKSN